MKVIINGRFLLHRTTGVERYAREILLELDKIIKLGECELAIPPETKDIPRYKNINIVRIGKLNNRLWEHISFPKYVKKQKGISINLCNVAPLSSPGIVCIHDMKVKTHPEYFNKKFKLWYEILFLNEAKRAKKIITVSEFSKNEIIKYYGVKEEKIVVISNAWQHYERIKYDEQTLLKYGLEKKGFYFAMGSMEPNKNFKWIVEKAIKTPNQIYAIAGAINDKVFSNGLGIKCPDNVKLLGFVSDEEAKTLMRDCKGFLFPSFCEGFGIPPLEAASAGANTLIVSDIPVMHEVFENEANYIDPNNSDMKNKIRYDLNPRRILYKYSWKKSAEDLLKLLNDF